MTEPILQLKGLKASIADQPEVQILHGIDLEIAPGEIHAVMGPNGSGKSTMASTIAGSPSYVVDEGQVLLNGEDITAAAADERARKGVFLSFQYPTPIPGVTMVNLLREALKARRGEEMPAREFLEELRATLSRLKMPEEMARRYVNEGFSGGEKKRAEILQMGMLRPSLAILDETDSGLDVDALRTVAEGVMALREPNMGILIITHYERILNYITPDKVHILVKGKIVKSGDASLAKEIEANGYDPILKELGLLEGATA
ncbi:MAG: Fe-S cluster assembly ATPase SufC [Dehalococcoidia bacterium]|nr:Fe-S cluster assembly ATPase SufC [Dehalococcoidia bacterium]MCA9857423.1 Fe-S cluster assembly ATPase SufC [Dehalococcoidia bacterium]MCB9482879.1 Fe-S cluster assembly ATPase SufC [Dehalococcoidia bacterium]MCB9491487.1 Fe-S cluster assembly ATPase SufC [Dehalococcoidia bacterium]